MDARVLGRRMKDLRDLESALKALANLNRLQLLAILQTPTRAPDVVLPAGRPDSWGGETRAISRQAIEKHIEALMEAGLVRRVEGIVPSETRLVTNVSALFALVERLRELVAMRPAIVPEDTKPVGSAEVPPLPPGPRLVLARGAREGRSFALSEEPGDWTIGRERGVAIALQYDPFVSTEHARIVHSGSGFFLVDLATNKNGTYLNWRRLERGASAPLSAGDVVGVGASLLIFRR